MIRFRWVFMSLAALVLLLACILPLSTKAPATDEVLVAMKRATEFMVEKVSYRGGYVWSYLPDFSRRWGEMEAYSTMIWVQPPGTGTMGHLFLDAYHVTGDDYYYQAAQRAAEALIAGQHPSGGWNYMIDFAGEESMRRWYDTIGRNGWRLEEFHHYYGNATFDDAGTAEAAKLLLRLYIEKKNPQHKSALDKAIRFVLDSQYPIGGWPQRYPPAPSVSLHGRPDYTAYITFNDDVAAENIEFLIMCYQALGDTRLLEPIRRAMNAFIVMQLPQPQPGWAMQYTSDLKPAGARSYEPKAVSTQTTMNNIQQLMLFYRMTGDAKFIARIPEALDWLDAVRFPQALITARRTHPMFVELGTNKPLFLHRRGSNVSNGEYYVDYNPENTISHYRSGRIIDVAALRAQYLQLKALPLQQLIKDSPLQPGHTVPLPQFFTLQDLKISDYNSRSEEPREPATPQQVTELVAGLNATGYWPIPLIATTNPYIGPGTKEITPGDFAANNVGDQYDTSVHFTDQPVTGISTGVYIKNMSLLIEYLTMHSEQ